MLDAGRGAAPAPQFAVECAPPFMTVRFPSSRRTLGWSLLHPGFATVREVVWVEVRNRDLGPDVDASAFLRQRLADAGLPDALALMTSRDIRRWRLDATTVEDVEAACLTTVGLSNGERVGSRFPVRPVPGTVNTLVHVSRPLTDGAFVEAISIAAQSRTAAILDAHPPHSGQRITGTGTDCIVVAAPIEGAATQWAGLHTAVGEAIGAVVYRATREGAEEWFAEFAPARPREGTSTLSTV
ncbi:adenosylcobinamide hydrolase [Roseiarcus fermentans]|uniref:Adenosylcobinamide hydrolase n=1 Tax=Roseiarcus fermentans TaxID=1473586 RepID=A0A366FEP7_9HYPH|nr:adenosylcobinamide amidohydrolase [Roseiarcus fermentans]RBP13152.1 adenosylcobinamide hydrolase [Roseiarcus fermentans]